MIELLKNIKNGYDGLIRQVNIVNLKKASIIISAEKIDEKEWVNIQIECENLVEFSIQKKINHGSTVLSDGISYKNFNGIHYIDFSPYSELMDEVNDYRRSNIYFASAKISYKILPYSE